MGTATKEDDDEDVSRKARWIIITTAVSLFVMSVLLVGIMLRLAPVIDDLGESRFISDSITPTSELI